MPAKIKSKNYVFSLIIMTIIMFLFYRSFYWQTTEIGKRKILEALLIIIGIVVVPLVAVIIPKVNEAVGRFIDGCTDLIKYIRENMKKIIVLAGIYVVILGISCGIELFLDTCIYHTEFNILRYYIVVCFNTVIYVFFVARKIISTRPEVLFFIIVMVMGITFIKVTPPLVGVSWDDQIHYERTLFLANSFNGISYSADKKMIAECENNSIQKTGYDRKSRKEYLNELNDMYDNREIDVYNIPEITPSFVSYVPAAVGIILARGAGLSYIHIFEFGKLCNLILYAGLMYFAIKKIKYGKFFVCVFGMLPLLVFLASSYSYDSWLTAFSILGFSYLISSMSEEDERKCTKDMIWGVVFIAIGCLVKQVYFPLTFIAIFIAMYNFKDKKKSCIKISLLVMAVSIILLASFIIPMLFSPASATDTRGGADVNVVGQIKYVLDNPFVYAGNLLRFFKSYLAIESMSYLTCFAYAGNGEYWGITAVVLIIVAFLDRNNKTVNYMLIRTFGIIMSFVTIVIVASSLYAAFTPVGADTVAGCSPRYIVPVLFPFLYLIAPDGVEVKYNKKLLAVIPIIILSVVSLHSLNALCASLYI